MSAAHCSAFGNHALVAVELDRSSEGYEHLPIRVFSGAQRISFRLGRVPWEELDSERAMLPTHSSTKFASGGLKRLVVMLHMIT
jgi:hypothetical protein